MMDSKAISFMVMMGALGNILFLISYYVGPISPGVALDFSLVGAFLAGIFGGPLIGLISGLFVGVLPGIFFGPLGTGSWLGLIGLPIGKALTGLTSGLIAKWLNLGGKQHCSFTIPVVLISYVPECLFTVAYFLYLMPIFLGSGGGGARLLRSRMPLHGRLLLVPHAHLSRQRRRHGHSSLHSPEGVGRSRDYQLPDGGACRKRRLQRVHQQFLQSHATIDKIGHTM